VNGAGIAIGPNLSGAGAMGVEGLLRNILQPNDKLESGYYRHDITLKNGTLASGFLSSEDQNRVVLRQIGADDRAIPRDQIESHKISKRSLMPEGLIDGYTDRQVADLFAYLMSLK
jgi:putative heme-binding domain-containing protein